MTLPGDLSTPLRYPDKLFIGGAWRPASSAALIDVVDSSTEQVYFRVADGQAADMSRAADAARVAFDEGPWPRMTHPERGDFLRALAVQLRERRADFAEIWARQSGVIHRAALGGCTAAADLFDLYADLGTTYAFEEPVTPTAGGQFGILVREPVGVVGAIIPWNGPLGMIAAKVAPAFLAGCTVVLKCSPEAPGESYLVAEIAESIGLPAGVLNVIAADREVSERLVRDRRVDKISFTGSTAAGRRVAAICGARIARVTLELGGKSAAVVLDDYDIAKAAAVIARQGRHLSGQVCSALTRVVVMRDRHDALVEALASIYSEIQVGDPFDAATEMGPLALERQRNTVESYIAKGSAEGADLVTGGSRPRHLERGWYIEPTVFGQVDNRSTIAQEEIFGPVLSVIPVEDEKEAVAVANDTIYGLNASVFTDDVDRARRIAGQIRSGTVGHNAWRTDFGVAFGGYKQSGIGREGGKEGLLAYLETKFMVLQGRPEGFAEPRSRTYTDLDEGA